MRYFIVIICLGACSSSPPSGPTTDVARDGDGDGSDLSADFDRDAARDFGTDLRNDILVSSDLSEDQSSVDVGPRLSNALATQSISTSITSLESRIDLAQGSNALPFLSASYNLTDPALHYVLVDAEIDNNVLILSRDEDPLLAGEMISISGNVAALDPERFSMQCSRFQSGTAIARVTITAVDPTKSFINFWTKISTGSNNKNVAHMSARFETPEQVILERVGPDGTSIGHVCVTESIGDTFATQHAVSSLGVGELSVDIPITPVELSRSLLMVSHRATRLESKPGYSQISCQLNADFVRCERGLNENEIPDIRVQVVTFSDRTTVSHHSAVIDDGVFEATVAVPGATADDSVLLGTIGVLGSVLTDADDKAFVPGSYVEASMQTDGVLLKRGLPGVGRIVVYPQVVKW